MSTSTTTASTGDDDVITIPIKWGKELTSIAIPKSLLRDNSTTNDSNNNSIIQYIQNEIYKVTNVPIVRQKLMCSKPKNLWKGILKSSNDSTTKIDWNKLLLVASESGSSNSGIQFLLMGSPGDIDNERLLEPPKSKTIFIEDMKEEEIAILSDPSGLVNLGNTCYLNSVIQCLRVIPQFQTALSTITSSSSSSGRSNNNFFISTLRHTLIQLQKQTTPVQPITLVQATKLTFPQFGQVSPSTHQPMQQDAEEFYSQLLSFLATSSSNSSSTTSGASGSNTSSNSSNSNPIDTIFGIQLKETITCDEFTTPDITDGSANNTSTLMGEPPVIRYDTSRKLVCNIQGGGIVPSSTTTATNGTQQQQQQASIPTNITFINDGIQLGLTTKIIKHSNILQRDAVWTSQQRIVKLPQILTIQFGRFYWKLTPDSADHTGVKCKIMKPITFHSTLDIYDFCSTELQSIIQSSRQKQLLYEEELLNAKLLGKDIDSNKNHANNNDNNTTNKKVKMDIDDATVGKTNENENMDEDVDDDELKAALAMSLNEQPSNVAAANNTASDNETNTVFGPGISNDFLGYYELFAVVTHKGRDADGGHYMAWVKADHNQVPPVSTTSTTTTTTDATTQSNTNNDDDANDDWYVFDDDEVSKCKTEDVLKLKGGGDWHMSYLNFYRTKQKK